jgi:hypothetical protein
LIHIFKYFVYTEIVNRDFKSQSAADTIQAGDIDLLGLWTPPPKKIITRYSSNYEIWIREQAL